MKSVYSPEACCSSSGSNPLQTPLGAIKKSLPPVTHACSGPDCYDIILAGAGTGGLAAVVELARAAKASGEIANIMVAEAGRWLEPADVQIKGELVIGPGVEKMTTTNRIPSNWPAAADANLRAYARRIEDTSSPTLNTTLLVNGVFTTYAFLPNTFHPLINTLLQNFLADPVSFGPIANHPNITLALNPPFPGMTVTYTGPLLGLLPSTWSDPVLNLLHAYSGSEDMMFSEATYPSADATKSIQMYPRGKTVGGSSVVNAAVHFGFTDSFLQKFADLVGDPWFA